VIDVELTGCPEYNTTLDNNCEGRPMVITFRYNGGDCSQSDNLQSRQKFSCIDTNGGPPRVLGAPGYVVATKAGGDDLYFAGPVAVGETFTLNEDETFDKLAADMTIQFFDAEGGNLLQTDNVHLSCSQQLFLFDRFGSAQVVEWKETDGRIVSSKQANIPTGTIQVKLNTDSDLVKPVILTEMNLIANALEFPIDYTDQVQGVRLEPGTVLELEGPRIDIDLSTRTRYTFFLALNGMSDDGATCNGSSFLVCEVGFNLDPIFATAVPTVSPTTTPYPTGALESTACEVDAAISCEVTSIVGLTCDEIKASSDDTCAAGAILNAAYLRYDGSLGDSVFVVVDCDGETFYDSMVARDETIRISTRFDVCEDGEVEVNVYDMDPEDKGTTLQESVISTMCPGPWTLGATIVPGFTLDAFVDTMDAVQFDVHIDLVEVQLDYVAVNSGLFPLNVVGATLSDGSSVGTLPVDLGVRSSDVLLSTTQVIRVGGQAGEIVTYDFAVEGQTSNQFALPCNGETSQIFEL
jgi:hypothetical protein